MTETRTIQSDTDKGSGVQTATSFVLGMAFLASPVVYATSHHQQFPPFIDTVAAVGVGIGLIALGIKGVTRKSGRG